MKRLSTFSFAAMFALGSFAQTIHVMPQYGSAYGGGVEVDINNNGYLDLVFGGLAPNPVYIEDAEGNMVETDKATKILLFNPDTKTYNELTTNIVNANRANFIAHDFNNDGIMDLLIADHSRDVFYAPGIYEGVGDGTFTKANMVFNDTEYQFRPVTVNAADFNNDGLVDIVAIGYESVDGVVTNHSAVLINKGGYNFDVTNGELLGDYQLALVTVKVLDHNNDGYTDFFVSGNCDNPESNNNARVLADIFENLGTEAPGTFYRLFLGDGTIFQKANGGLDIADFNSDGWLDFALHGEGGTGTGEPTSGEEWACISHLYINQKNGTYADKNQPNFSADLRPLNSSGTTTGVIDWDGNGTSDIFIPGWNPAPETNTQAGFYWLNDGTANFGEKNRVPGGSEIFMLFPDWNGDGIRDYFMIGQSWDSEFFTEEQKGRTSAVLINQRTNVNQRPSAPTGLNAAVNNGKVTLTWEPATDAETNAKALSYEYYIKNSDGQFITACRSHVGGNLDGVRKVLALGNAMLSNAITINGLADGTYQWGVQAIDASFDGSLFANGTFTVGQNSIDNLNKVIDNLVLAYAANGSLIVKSQLPANVMVYSVTGALLTTKNNINKLSVNLTKGTYIVRVAINNNYVSRKVVVN